MSDKEKKEKLFVFNSEHTKRSIENMKKEEGYEVIKQIVKDLGKK